VTILSTFTAPFSYFIFLDVYKDIREIPNNSLQRLVSCNLSCVKQANLAENCQIARRTSPLENTLKSAQETTVLNRCLGHHFVSQSLTANKTDTLQDGPKKLRQIFLAITLVNMDRF